MRPRVLLDTGPLVAFLDEREPYHKWAASRFAGLSEPLLTCESVLSEAFFLVRRLPRGGQAVMDLIKKGVVEVPFHLDQEAFAIAELMKRYATVPMSLADACLVRMAEQHANSVVLTLDRDFRLYRMHGRQVIPTIMPVGQ